MHGILTMPMHRPPSREEFDDLDATVGDLLKEFTDIKDLLKINTDLTSDIRAILRSSSILVGFIKTLGVCAGALAAIYAAYHAVQLFIRG